MTDGSSPLFVSTFGAVDVGAPGDSDAAHTLVCLHGIESHGLKFLGLAYRLAKVNLVAPDLRGHGRSPKVGPWTLEQHLDDLAPLVSRFGQPFRLSQPSGLRRPPVLLGHSYGGLLAWEVARATPTSVAALVLVDPAIGVSAEVARGSLTYEHSVLGHSWPDEAAAFSDFAVARSATGLWAAALDAAVGLEHDDGGRLSACVSRDAVEAGWRQMQEQARSSPWRGPTLLLEAGREHGRYVSSLLRSQLREQLGDQLDHRVLDATHTITSDYPDELAAAVNEFLSGLR
jgi:lipase